MLDLEDGFKVPFFIEPLLGTALIRLDLRKFGFPVAEHIGFQPGYAADLSDPVEKLTRFLGIR
jgi:hypothetical protein